MDNVLDFPKRQWMAFHARCLGCGHQWGAAAPLGARELECPKCQTMRGVPMGLVVHPEEHFACDCGCDMFRVTPEFFYCVTCGVKYAHG